jgi:hypothetical protein
MSLVHASNINQNKFGSASCRPARLRLKSAEFVPLAAMGSTGYNEIADGWT